MIRLANKLSRSLVIPPFKCENGKKYCNLCDIFGMDCGQAYQNMAEKPIKESVCVEILMLIHRSISQMSKSPNSLEMRIFQATSFHFHANAFKAKY